MTKISDYRAELNQWAENKLPGGNVWSEDLLESYHVFRRTYPFLSLTAPLFAGITASNVSDALSQPNFRNVFMFVLPWVGVGMHLKLQHDVKRNYDLIGERIQQGYLPSLIKTAETNPRIRKFLDLYVSDHGLQEAYEAAHMINEVTTRGHSFG